MDTSPESGSLPARLAQRYPYYRRLRWLLLPVALLLGAYWWSYQPPLGVRGASAGQPADGEGQFAAGRQHSVRIGADGGLYAAGYNGNSVVSPDTTAEGFQEWRRVGGRRDWVRVASGEYHGLALRADSSLWAWGDNGFGQLGPGAPAGHARNAVPVRVPGRYVRAVGGGYFSLAFAVDGRLYVWGDNAGGQLGYAPRPGADPATYRAWPSPTPRPVPGRWAAVAAGERHVLALAANGDLYAWGANEHGQLGPGAPADSLPHPRPVRVPGRYAEIAAGYTHSLALTADGQLWAWGANESGQLGTPAQSYQATQRLGNLYLSTPYHVPGRWAHVVAGGYHSLALRANGQLWAWGSNGKGELARSPNEDSAVPAPVPGRYRRASGGSSFTLALSQDGRLYAWGENGNGELGYATQRDYFNDAPQPEPRVSE